MTVATIQDIGLEEDNRPERNVTQARLCDIAAERRVRRAELVRAAAEAAAIRAAHDSMVGFARLMRPRFGALPGFQIAICRALDRVVSGACKRLIITMPPQHGKSEIAVRLFPAFFLGHHPAAKIIMASYSHGLVSHHSRDAREIVRHSNYRALFPASRLSRDAQAVEAWETMAGGRVVAAGRDGAITGHSADLIVADDLLANREEAESATMLEKVWDFWTSTLMSRTHVGTAIVLIGTRWSTQDPIGRVLAGPGRETWETLMLPALAEEGDMLGRPVGAALWPERHPADFLASKRLDIGEHEFQSLYQGRPYARGGQYIRRGWFVLADESSLPSGLVWTRGLDLAVSAKQTADYSASVRVARAEKTIYVADGWYRRAEWPIIKRLVVERAQAERARLAVEAVAGFDVAYRELAESLRGVCVVTRVTATRDKLTRALPWIAAAECGRVVLVRSGVADRDVWIAEFLSQAEAFPAQGVHDDLVDAVSIAVEASSVSDGVQLSFCVERDRRV